MKPSQIPPDGRELRTDEYASLVEELTEIVNRSHLFKTLDVEGRQRVLESGYVATFAAGDTLMRQDEEGSTMYLVLNGKIRIEAVNAEWAIAAVQEELEARFESFENEYLRERREDIKDVAQSIIRNLVGIAHHDLSETDHDVVVLADDLTPSDTVRFNRRPIVGFATESGGIYQPL